MSYTAQRSDCGTGYFVADPAGRPVPYTMTRTFAQARAWAKEENDRERLCEGSRNGKPLPEIPAHEREPQEPSA